MKLWRLGAHPKASLTYRAGFVDAQASTEVELEAFGFSDATKNKPGKVAV